VCFLRRTTEGWFIDAWMTALIALEGVQGD